MLRLFYWFLIIGIIVVVLMLGFEIFKLAYEGMNESKKAAVVMPLPGRV